MSDWYEILEATVDHCDAIRALIQELADFEEMPKGPKLSAAELARDLVENCWFGYVVLLKKPRENLAVGTMIGYSICNYHYSTWEGKFLFIEDIYVTAKFRANGIGTAVWRQIAKVKTEPNLIVSIINYQLIKRAVNEGLPRLQWAVLNWNKTAINFYEKIGGFDLTVKEKWHIYRLTKENIKKLSGQ